MSGTSLDGLDIAYCELVMDKKWNYKILAYTTIPYSEKREKILKNAAFLSAEELRALDAKYGKYIGEECKKFIAQHQIQPDLICSHGHTVFHQPQKEFTLQVGNGSYIYAETGLPVICDFRTQDVALGGQGAPLVPIGDELLFSTFDACLNLGGFANISAQENGNRIAWDICAVNTVLNHYAGKTGLKFDEGGKMAKAGSFFAKLFQDLQQMNYYTQLPPKSLGMEWVNSELMHLLEKYPLSVEDLLHTYTRHIACQVGKAIDEAGAKKVLITGGGVYNDFLLEKIKEETDAIVTVPDDATIQYKEALIFALLGVLKYRKEINVLRSVTGAREDHSSGVIYGQV